MILSVLGFPKQVDVLFIILTGIGSLAFDSSLFHLKEDLEQVWNHDFDAQFQKNNIDILIKYTLSAVILVRTFTLHLFIALYIVMLWPAYFEDRPNLMLPWMVVGLVRSVLVNLVTLCIGSYVCLRQKGAHPICLDFVLSQIIEHGLSVSSWFTIRSYYLELHQTIKRREKRRSQAGDLSLRRQQTRRIRVADDKKSMFSESTVLSRESQFSLCSGVQEVKDEDSLLTGKSLETANTKSVEHLLSLLPERRISRENDLQDDDLKMAYDKVMELLTLSRENLNEIHLDKYTEMAEKLMRAEDIATKSALTHDMSTEIDTNTKTSCTSELDYKNPRIDLASVDDACDNAKIRPCSPEIVNKPPVTTTEKICKCKNKRS